MDNTALTRRQCPDQAPGVGSPSGTKQHEAAWGVPVLGPASQRGRSSAGQKTVTGFLSFLRKGNRCSNLTCTDARAETEVRVPSALWGSDRFGHVLDESELGAARIVNGAGRGVLVGGLSAKSHPSYLSEGQLLDQSKYVL